MATITLWGSIDGDGRKESGSTGFSVSKQEKGQYVISFSPTFSGTPAMVATQTRHGRLDQETNDGVVIPLLTNSSATLLTGKDNGNHEDRSFSFIAIGPS
jgi:hypothetical protein